MIQISDRKRIVYRSITWSILLLAIIMVAGCSPRVAGHINVRVDDDMATQIRKNETVYAGMIPGWVIKGTKPDKTDFSATVKITIVEGTRTVRGEITSPTDLWSQDPDHIGVIFYLCQPLATTADKLSDGTVAYHGTGYPAIVVGHSYNVTGVLQPQWQDYPLVYVPTAADFTEVSK